VFEWVVGGYDKARRGAGLLGRLTLGPKGSRQFFMTRWMLELRHSIRLVDSVYAKKGAVYTGYSTACWRCCPYPLGITNIWVVGATLSLTSSVILTPIPPLLIVIFLSLLPTASSVSSKTAFA